MLLARMIMFAMIGAGLMVFIHRLNTGGYDHIGITIGAGLLIGLFGCLLDNARRRHAAR